jgi:ribosomal RNA-processing protein 9
VPSNLGRYSHCSMSRDPFFRKRALEEELESIEEVKGLWRARRVCVRVTCVVFAGGRSGARGGRDDDDEPSETPDEKRVRLARMLLDQVRSRVSSSDEELPPGQVPERGDAVSRGLLRAAARQGHYASATQQKLRTPLVTLAKAYSWSELPAVSSTLTGHRLPITCMSVTGEQRDIVTGAKDGIVRVYDGTTLQRSWKAKTNGSAVYTVSTVVDGPLMLSGGKDGGTVSVWDTRQAAAAALLKGHRGDVTATCVDRESIWSAALDLTVKQWDLRQLAFMTTSYGHQERINQMQSIGVQRQMTCSDDKSVHVWHHEKSQQLVFRRPAPTQAVECVASLQQSQHQQFVSGGQDGDLCNWHVTRKKPASAVARAHGGCWITSVATAGTMAVSGSYDGYVRLWDCAQQMQEVAALPCPGFVNALHCEWLHDERQLRLWVATGKEHRWGRWWYTKTDEDRLGANVCHGALNTVYVAVFDLDKKNGRQDAVHGKEEQEDPQVDDEDEDEDGDEDDN